MGKILGVDLGKQTGWGWFNKSTYRFGTVKIVSQWQPYGACMLVLEDRLHQLILQHRPEVIAVARPFVRKGKVSFDTTQNLLPMFGSFIVLSMLASAMHIPLEVVEEGEARSSLVGKKMLRRKSAHAKEDVIRAWRSRGVEVANDHEADALCVALEAERRMLGKRGYETSPLWDAAATMAARIQP
jgi:Holliday junction resolvasome RuvABC endonuclease subunit